MARSHRRTVRVRRPIVIMHRGARAPSTEDSRPGINAVYYVASVRGGPCDLELTFTDGVLQPLGAPLGRSLDELNYDLGAAQSLSGGFGWNGDGALSVPFVQLVGQDSFQTYSLGGVAEGALNNGSGWNGSAVLFAW